MSRLHEQAIYLLKVLSYLEIAHTDSECDDEFSICLELDNRVVVYIFDLNPGNKKSLFYEVGYFEESGGGLEPVFKEFVREFASYEPLEVLQTIVNLPNTWETKNAIESIVSYINFIEVRNASRDLYEK